MYKNSLVTYVNGYELELYTIGYTAKLLRISTETIRAWERSHIMPRPMFTYKNGVRLYHPKEVQAIAKVLRKKHFRGTYKKQEKLKQELWKALSEARQEILALTARDEEVTEASS